MDLRDTPLSPMQASKWLKSPCLIDEVELASLFKEIAPFFLYRAGKLSKRGTSLVDSDYYVNCYKEYILSIKDGNILDINKLRYDLSAFITLNDDALYATLLPEEKELIRPKKPVVQAQMHTLDYSNEEKKFYSMTFGQECISWGLLFSYPQLYQDPITFNILKVKEQFSNTKLFHMIQKWMRRNTTPTPFVVEGKVVWQPYRLGKRCFPWINQHPGLIAKGIKVHAS